jgi:hypothetical protein
MLMFRPRITALLAFAFLLLWSATASATPMTYWYTGNPFTTHYTFSVNPPMFSLSSFLIAQVTLDITQGQAASNLIASDFSLYAVTINGGLIGTQTPLPPPIDNTWYLQSNSFSVDANGQITNWDFGIYHFPLSLTIGTTSSGDNVVFALGGPEAANNQNPGTWTTPEPSIANLFTVMLLSLGAMLVRFRRCLR